MSLYEQKELLDEIDEYFLDNISLVDRRLKRVAEDLAEKYFEDSYHKVEFEFSELKEYFRSKFKLKTE